MYIRENSYFDDKDLIYNDIKEVIVNPDNIDWTVNRVNYECVECGTDEEDEIISDLIFEDSHLTLTNTIYHLPSLKNNIEKFDNGFKFTRLNEKEYADLKSIVERLKEFIKANEHK
jgi:hypothetical protein